MWWCTKAKCFVTKCVNLTVHFSQVDRYLNNDTFIFLSLYTTTMYLKAMLFFSFYSSIIYIQSTIWYIIKTKEFIGKISNTNRHGRTSKVDDHRTISYRENRCKEKCTLLNNKLNAQYAHGFSLANNKFTHI